MNTISRTLALLALLTLSASSQSTLNVPSPTYPTIQSAIAAAAPSGDTVQVAAGVYVENLDFLGKQLTLQGAGMGQTILDGGQNGSVIVMQSGEGPFDLVQDVTIQNGTGTSYSTINGSLIWGGGVFLNNYASGVQSHPIFRRCRFANNHADAGGGIYALYSWGLTLEDCVFENNDGGAAGSFDFLDLQVRRCRFENNVAHGGGGALGMGGFASNFSTILPVIEDCVFRNNTAVPSSLPFSGSYSAGGAIVTAGGAYLARRCVFDGNTADRGGVAYDMDFQGSANRIFEDCLFINNSAATYGGCLAKGGFWGNLEVRNCTFYNNTSASSGAVIWSDGVTVVPFSNCIFWNNSGGTGLVEIYSNDNSVSFTHCDVDGGWTGAGSGNIAVDPLFEDAANGDFHIRPDSPCIDAGAATAAFAALDSDGDPRPLFGGVDIGYDECADFSLTAAAAGTAGLAATGSPVDVLTVNGNAGGALRRVDLALGQSFAVGVQSPPGAAGGADFVLYGLVGTAKAGTVTSLPFGLPDLVLPPCDLAATFQPFVFTLASSVSSLACSPLVATPPAPWTSPSWSLPFPITFTLQGLIVDGPSGAVASTNALRVRVQ